MPDSAVVAAAHDVEASLQAPIDGAELEDLMKNLLADAPQVALTS